MTDEKRYSFYASDAANEVLKRAELGGVNRSILISNLVEQYGPAELKTLLKLKQKQLDQATKSLPQKALRK